MHWGTTMAGYFLEKVRSTLQRLVGLLIVMMASSVLAQGAGSDFDHLKTGFALTGMHTNARCESCHVSGVFKGTPRDCASCHTAGARFAVGNLVKPQQHIPTTTGCETCHATRTFTGAKFTHSGVSAGSCTTCHNGLTAPGKSPNHSPTQTSCDSCHSTSAFLPAKRADHSSFTAATNCASCHTSGGSATGKSANHIPTTANCMTCHKAFSGWTPSKYHANVSVVTGCASCHATAVYGLTAKPNTAVHNGVTVCESCHRSTASWSSVQFAHSAANAVGTGTCDNCHNGSAAVGKSAPHIPVTTGVSKCDSCHKSQSSFATSVTMNHSVVTSTACKTCHNGTYVSQGNNGGAMAKPGNHIPESQLQGGSSMDCNACHSSTASWASQKMNHNASMGSGSGWCKSCHSKGTAFLGSMEKESLLHEAKSGTSPADCSTSGCHKPLGNKGAAYSKWD